MVGVGNSQYFDGCGEVVAGLGGHDDVAAAHDAELQCQAHGRVLVLVFAREGAEETF